MKEPVFPEYDGTGKPFRVRKIYSDILEVVKLNPDIITGDIARKLGRPSSIVEPFVWKLRKYTGDSNQAKLVDLDFQLCIGIRYI